MHDRVARRKPLLSKNNCCPSARKIMRASQRAIGEVFCGQMRPKLYNNIFFLMRSVTFGKKNTAFQHKKPIPSVKHGGGSNMVWACFAASGPGRLAIIDGTKNSELYQQLILKENIRTSVPGPSLKIKWAMQQDNDHKHTSHFTKEWLKKNKVNVLEWSGPFV